MSIFAETSAYAKLNLGLKVLGRRPDGYHDILSVFQTIDLCDRLTFEEISAGQTEVVCSDPGLPAGPENLVYRAVEALRGATGLDRGVRVSLTKAIPVGAGLGGGSADAAAVLRILNRAWGQGMPDRRLQELALGIGSDVPFFLRNGTAVVSGRGEVLRYVSWPSEVHYLLIHPLFQVSTGWAYGQVSGRINLTLTSRSKYVKLINSIVDGPICVRDLFACIENDFEPVVAEAWPALGELRRALQETGADACCMTGSGSVLYGVFFDAAAADRATVALRKGGCRVFPCRPLIVDG
ncbi:MAG: 4-(cytidine 5'-diphospho)-2-C-methyl-D-erythritol kinase [Candidatus Latescibacteria bacterium]|nr:4-(cytidine 5'-diphospho)-2-C-methyl-D-erythritol kinase [Candidatus Latescibacterota bacterium]